MINVGQVRRWLHPDGIRGEGTEVFIVIRKTGKFHSTGWRKGEPMLDHWEIVCGGEVMPGWSSRTLETESALVSE